MASDKNAMVSQSDDQKDSYRVKASDFPSKGAGKAGQSSGHDQLCDPSETQEHPRYAQDEGAGENGAGTPSVWASGGQSKIVASNFPVQTNKGEGDSSPSKVSIPEAVDFSSGEISGGSKTRVGEVPQSNVSIGRR